MADRPFIGYDINGRPVYGDDVIGYDADGKPVRAAPASAPPPATAQPKPDPRRQTPAYQAARRGAERAYLGAPVSQNVGGLIKGTAPRRRTGDFFDQTISQFGISDELAGAANALATGTADAVGLLTGKRAPYSMGDAYLAGRDVELQRQRDFAQQRPIANAASVVASIPLLTPAATRVAAAANTANAAQNTARLGKTMVGQVARDARPYSLLRQSAAAVPLGAALGAAHADDGKRLQGAGIGGALSFGTTFGLGAALARLGMTPDQRAADIINRRLSGMKRTGNNPNASVTNELQTRATRITANPGPTAETVMDIGGDGAFRLARASANVGTRGPEVARDRLLSREGGFLNEGRDLVEGGAAAASSMPDRVGTTSSRIMDALQKALSAQGMQRSPRTFGEALDALKTSRRAFAAEEYNAARAAMMRRPEAAQQVARAMQIKPGVIDHALDATQDDLDDLAVTLVRASVDGADDQTVAALQSQRAALEMSLAELKAMKAGQPTDLSPQTIVSYDAGLTRAASALAPAPGQTASPAFVKQQQFGDSVRGLLDQQLPELANARAHYALGHQIERAMREGQKIMTARPEEVAAVLRPLNAQGVPTKIPKEAATGYAIGAIDSLEQTLTKNDFSSMARILRSAPLNKALTEALGDKASGVIRTRLLRELGMRMRRQGILGGAEGVGSRTAPMAQDIKELTGDEAFAIASEVVRSGGDIKSPIINRLLQFIESMRAPGLRNEAVNAAVAERLYAPATRGKLNTLAEEIRSANSGMRGRTSGAQVPAAAGTGPAVSNGTQKDDRRYIQ